ncbi:MAG: hypothetical protein HYZ45_13875 [Burkholderiales bacterium]|nr:hypothetical protein [Burkholderiales bacterium]
MKKITILLLVLMCSILWGCDKADYEEHAEKAAKERAERNRADHERRSE